jgi:hypothetical protein
LTGAAAEPAAPEDRCQAAPFIALGLVSADPASGPARDTSAWSSSLLMLVVIDVHSLSILAAPFWIEPAAFLMLCRSC